MGIWAGALHLYTKTVILYFTFDTFCSQNKKKSQDYCLTLGRAFISWILHNYDKVFSSTGFCYFSYIAASVNRHPISRRNRNIYAISWF